MTRPWEPRDITARLGRHAVRLGDNLTKDKDSVEHFQIFLLRNFLDLLRSAMDDEEVDPEVARRVINLVMYGGYPMPGQRGIIERWVRESPLD